MKYDDIKKEVEECGWQLLSTTYTNLKTDMTFKCPNGHSNYYSLEKWRHGHVCSICENNPLANVNTKPVKKKGYRILALDQASITSGWSIFDNEELITYGIFETQHADEIARDHEVKVWLVSMLNNWEPDYIGIEGIQYQQQMGVTTFETLARLQGILMDLCYELKYNYNICPTNTWRHFCGVKGRSRVDKKRSTQLLIKQWYDITVGEDVADAIGIGRYMAKSVVKQPEVIEWE